MTASGKWEMEGDTWEMQMEQQKKRDWICKEEKS